MNVFKRFKFLFLLLRLLLIAVFLVITLPTAKTLRHDFPDDFSSDDDDDITITSDNDGGSNNNDSEFSDASDGTGNYFEDFEQTEVPSGATKEENIPDIKQIWEGSLLKEKEQ